MAPNGNTRWPHTALLTRSTSGPERQYRWPPKAQILILSLASLGHAGQSKLDAMTAILNEWCDSQHARDVRVTHTPQ